MLCQFLLQLLKFNLVLMILLIIFLYYTKYTYLRFGDNYKITFISIETNCICFSFSSVCHYYENNYSMHVLLCRRNMNYIDLTYYIKKTFV